MSDNKDKMVDSITIQHLEDGTFEETTVYKDGSSLIEIFDDGILISRRELNGTVTSPKLQKMLEEIGKNNLDYRKPNNKKAEDILDLIRSRQRQCARHRAEENNAKIWIQRLIDQNR
jgi:hypothetical protein